MNKCCACGEPIRRGYPMVTKKGENVIICERCKRLWKKLKSEEQDYVSNCEDYIFNEYRGSEG